MLRRPAICSFVLLMLVITPVLSATAVSVQTKTTSVAAFKNGLGFFVREGTATLKDGWATSDEVPTAALGTFWVGSPKAGVSVERLLALQEDNTLSVPAITVAEILESNVGKQVKITYGDKVITGKLLAVPQDRAPTGPVQPLYPASSYIPPTSQSQLVLVETATGTVAITKSSISMVEFEGKVNSDREIKEKVKRLKFKLAGAKESAPITIGYLQKGVSWSPAYLLELLDDKTARITMQGLLVNDVEDIEGADVSFVVGYPNFMFSDMVSPLSLTQSISQFIDNLANPSSRSRSGAGGYGGIMAQSIAYNTAEYDYSGSPAPDFGYSSMKETPGAQEEDLFLYHMTDVSLRKGERAYYTVFSAEVPFEHVYKWTVNDTSGIQPNGYVSSNRNDTAPPPEDQVWHALKLTNSSKFPWTTAPAMAMSKGKPLAQDTLSYTPKGAEGDLKLTIATDIRAKTSELEKSRENASGVPFSSSSSFNKVTSEGTLTLKSFKSRPVTVQVTKTIIGEVTSTGLNGKVEKMGVKIRAVNPTSVVTWDVPLDPGEEKTLDYAYFTYIRY